jgi:hypothetical protein
VTTVAIDPFPIQWRGGVPATSISCNPTSETGIYTAVYFGIISFSFSGGGTLVIFDSLLKEHL